MINPDKIAKNMFGNWNSTDGEEAKILFRLVNGVMGKMYVTHVPLWAPSEQRLFSGSAKLDMFYED